MAQRLKPGLAAGPAAALICALAGKTPLALALAAACLAGTLLSLGAGIALRRASGRLISGQRYFGAALFALGMAALGALVGQMLAEPMADGLLALQNTSNPADLAIADATLAELLGGGPARIRTWLGIGAALTAGQCVGFALDGWRRPGIARALDALTCALLAAALLAMPAAAPSVAVAMAGCGLVAAVWTGLRGHARPLPSLAPLRESPAALAHALVYPALATAMIALQTDGFAQSPGEAPLIGWLAGWLIVELLRPARRMDRDSNLSLRIFAGIFTLIVAFIALLWNVLDAQAAGGTPIVRGIALASACLLALGAAPRPRSVIAALLLLAASLGTAASESLRIAIGGSPERLTAIVLALAALASALLASQGAIRRLRVWRVQRRIHRARRAA